LAQNVVSLGLGRQDMEIFLILLCLFKSDLKLVILCGFCKITWGVSKLRAFAQM